jgi:hypothetical protein
MNNLKSNDNKKIKISQKFKILDAWFFSPRFWSKMGVDNAPMGVI